MFAVVFCGKRWLPGSYGRNKKDHRCRGSRKEADMNGENVQGSTLLGNEAVRGFLELLVRERPDAGRAYSVMLAQMDGMGKQLDAALKELAEVKGQLAGMREGPEKSYLSQATDAAGNRLHAMKQGLMEIKQRIIEGAREAVAGVKQAGIKALDKAVSAIGIKKGLKAMQESLSCSISDVKGSIEKVEAMGKELRSVGGHLKNVGRAAFGKEQKVIDGGTEGRFQAAVLAPMRREKRILDRMNNLVLAAIGSVERLEEAGEQARSGAVREQDKTDAAREESGEKPERERPDKADGSRREEPPKTERKAAEKPSVLKDLQEGKRQAASHAAPAAEKMHRAQEAAI